jgi:NADPH-dependent curcumin reductase CurA
MRGWMNEGKSYIPPVGIGEVMRAGGIGVVVASKATRPFAVGDTGERRPGRAGILPGAGREIKRSGLVKHRPAHGLRLTQWLNVLGMPGMTAISA